MSGFNPLHVDERSASDTSEQVASLTTEFSRIRSVGLGDTNHDTNMGCGEKHKKTVTLTQDYSENGIKDAKKIFEVAEKLKDVDDFWTWTLEESNGKSKE